MKVGSIVRFAVLLLSMGCSRGDTPLSEAPAQHDRLALVKQEGTMHATKSSDNEILLTQMFAAPRETIFDALTKVEHLGTWMRPTEEIFVTLIRQVEANLPSGPNQALHLTDESLRSGLASPTCG